MSIKLIALDLDGTLLDSHKRLPERNKRALEQCLENGIHIVPCTGRTSIGIPESIRNMPGVRYAITTNGATIEDMLEKKILDRRLMDKETALEIIDAVKKYHVMYDAYIEGIGISEARFYYHLDEYNISPEIQELVRMTRRVYPNIIEYVKQWEGQVEKVNMYFSDMSEREEVRELLSRRGDVLVSSSVVNNLEINGPGAAKGEALLRLAEYLGIAREDTMAFGDGGNDYSMIKMAGIGVAMANGEPELKAAADHITTSNDEAGVAQAIEELVLSQL